MFILELSLISPESFIGIFWILSFIFVWVDKFDCLITVAVCSACTKGRAVNERNRIAYKKYLGSTKVGTTLKSCRQGQKAYKETH